MYKILWIVLGCILFTGIAAAEIQLHEKVSIDLEIRYRTEVFNRTFDLNQGAIEYSLLRTRLGMTFTPAEKVTMRVKIGDSRDLGTSYPNKPQSHKNDFNLHEGYMRIDDFLFSNLSLQLGRFQMLYGRMRFMGHGNWSNYGWRAYDGARFTYTLQSGSVDMFYVKLEDRAFADYPSVGDPVNPSEHALYGVVGTFMESKLQPFCIVDWDQAESNAVDATMIYTPGLYFHLTPGNFDIQGDLMFQGGKIDTLDHSAYLAAADVLYNVGGAWKTKVGIGFDLVSGDDDGSDDIDHAFYADFYSKHRYQGYCDFFKAQSAREAGLIDMIARLEVQPIPNWKFNLDLHNFAYERDRTNDLAEMYNQLGQEVDFRVRTSVHKAVSVDMAICGFQPSDDWKPDSDLAYFTYVALTATF